MSVLVKGWSIPTNGCCGCYFRTGKYCGILDKNERVLEHAERFTRPDNCPLVEVSTPHGRLIDADVTLKHIDEYYDLLKRMGKPSRGMTAVMQNIKTIVNSLPTIDAVPVIRCYECKYFTEFEKGFSSDWDGSCRYWNTHSTVYSNFCGCGARMRDE